MNILSTQYTLSTKSFEIYVAGCGGQPHCINCHNPETWDFNQGTEWNNEYYLSIVKPKVIEFSSIIDRVMIFGGEPLDQKHSELLTMLYDLKELNKDIWLFTRYLFEDIPEEIINCCDYIKCGRYIQELETEDNIQYGIKLSTINQYIYKNGTDY